MVFKKEQILVNFITSSILVFRNFFFLIFYPYKTMRKISLEKDYWQILIIFFLVFLYFKLSYFLKDKPYPASFTFFTFLVNFFLTAGFFYFLSKFIKKKDSGTSFKSLLFSLSYSLFPTLIWFESVSLLYLILPPPRTTSILGISFSIFFIAYSLSLLFWKLILVFLAIRFSLRLSFYQILYLWFLYLLWFIPYSILLYQAKLFRLPFI